MSDVPTTRRLHGDRYVRGLVPFLDDERPARCTHLVFVRSPHAHARIRGVDTTRARVAPGVLTALAGQDTAALIGPLLCMTPPPLTGTPGPLALPCLPVDLVRFVGEPVALVVAETVQQARAAADLVEVDYEVLAPALDTAAATEPDAVRQHPDLPTNVVMGAAVAQGDVVAGLGAAPRELTGRVRMHRSSAVALEFRGCVASWDAGTDRLIVRAAVQQPHAFRADLARQLGMAEGDVHVTTPPLGGAFGSKFIGLPEEPLTCLAAKVLGRAVRWVENRPEALLIGARDYDVRFRVGFDDTARVLALDAEIDADIGALTANPGPLMPMVGAATFPGGYDVADFEVRWREVMTNKGPWNGARGFGKEMTCLVLETALDDVARTLDLDPAVVRRRNLLTADRLPHRTPTMTLDSGDYPRALDLVLDLAGYDELRAEQQRRRGEDGASSTRLGVGVAFELTPEGFDGGGSLARGFETATVRLDTGGRATVLTGVTSPGTGSETAIAQLVAARLGMAVTDVRVVQGDTETTPYGSGSFSSRAVLAGGTAAHQAADDLRAKLIVAAATLLQTDPAAIEVVDGVYRVVGEPARGLPLPDLAMAVRTLGAALPGIGDPQLEATRTYGPENMASLPDAEGRIQIYPTYSYSVHVAAVEVEPDTGVTHLRALAAVHDCGTIVNPELVEAQLHGAVAMGVGLALLEEERYDAGGRPVATDFKRYLVPRIKDIPRVRTGHLESPSPFTVLGTKGAGESGVGGAAAAIVGAVRDAVAAAPGGTVTTPLVPARVLDLADHAAVAPAPALAGVTP